MTKGATSPLLHIVGVVAVATTAGCSSGATDVAAGSGDVGAPPSATPPRDVAESPAARERIAELRARFVIQGGYFTIDALPLPQHASDRTAPVLAAGVATSFEATENARLRAVLPAEARHAALRSATALLPLRANGAVELEDDTTHVAVQFALRGASGAPAEVADGIVLYRAALDGADVVHRVYAEGTEDFVVFEQRPAREQLEYDVDVSRVAGLRLVSNVLEFLDEGGAPRLRVAPPYVVDAIGVRQEVRVALVGCAYDADASGPWRRSVIRPGSANCTVRVGWQGVEYPAVVDPAWVATGSMAMSRYGHTATLLTSGEVLIAGGAGGGSTAELFDGTSSFAATGSMSASRSRHTATLLGSGKVLLAGGDSGNPSAELFDGTSSFSPTGLMTVIRSVHTATLLSSGKVLLTGGADAGFNLLSSAELFDGIASFAAIAPMSIARHGHSATLLASGKVLIAGGLTPGGTSSTAVSTAELFDGTASFSSTGSMTTKRYGQKAALLSSGKVLIAGGNDGNNNPLASAELFDGTSSFSVTGSMSSYRDGHTATVLGTGKVLIAGGGWRDSEIFDGVGNFVSSGSMTVSYRLEHTATLLGSGKVLVTGGLVSTASTAELFAFAASGSPCTISGECMSGVCEDGVCCAAACSGACKMCAIGTGACVAVMNADDPGTCTGVSTCDASGGCKLKNGQGCAADSACASAHCADGVCCDSVCAGSCQACTSFKKGTGIDGTCGSILSGTDPDSECTAQATSTCGLSGQCDGAGACGKWPVGTACTVATCNGTTFTSPSQCDVNGVCTAGTPSPCVTGYRCIGTSCATSCTDDTSCDASYICETASASCVVGTSGTGGSAGSSGAAGASTGGTGGTVASGGAAGQAGATATGGVGAVGGDAGAPTSGGSGGTGGTGGTAAAGSAATGGSAGCVAGDQKECACPGGAKGAQACRADGSGYERCSGCPSEPAATDEGGCGCAVPGGRDASGSGSSAIALAWAAAALERARRGRRRTLTRHP